MALPPPPPFCEIVLSGRVIFVPPDSFQSVMPESRRNLLPPPDVFFTPTFHWGVLSVGFFLLVLLSSSAPKCEMAGCPRTPPSCPRVYFFTVPHTILDKPPFTRWTLGRFFLSPSPRIRVFCEELWNSTLQSTRRQHDSFYPFR